MPRRPAAGHAQRARPPAAPSLEPLIPRHPLGPRSIAIGQRETPRPIARSLRRNDCRRATSPHAAAPVVGRATEPRASAREGAARPHPGAARACPSACRSGRCSRGGPDERAPFAGGLGDLRVSWQRWPTRLCRLRQRAAHGLGHAFGAVGLTLGTTAGLGADLSASRSEMAAYWATSSTRRTRGPRCRSERSPLRDCGRPEMASGIAVER